MVVAQVPHLIDSVIAKKALDWSADDPRVVEVADILERLMIRAVEAGEVGADGFDDQFVDLLDATMVEPSPGAERLVSIPEERGWKGRTRIERAPADRVNTQPGSVEQS
jgi:hypothetical protein